jgi:acyl-CoA thioesterase-2
VHDTRGVALDQATQLEGDGGSYAIELSREWEIWGPNGGYLAALALRAAGLCAEIAQPASFYCHFLRSPDFDRVELEVDTLRRGRRAESFAVRMTQHDKPVLQALVRTAADAPGYEHQQLRMPDVPAPETLPEHRHLPFAFWHNIERRLVEGETVSSQQAVVHEWTRLRPEPCFDDPFLDAARSLILLDTYGWPAAYRRYRDRAMVAPNLDTGVWFHQPAPRSEWLLIDHECPIGHRGLLGVSGRVWCADGLLLASDGGQHVGVQPSGNQSGMVSVGALGPAVVLTFELVDVGVGAQRSKLLPRQLTNPDGQPQGVIGVVAGTVQVNLDIAASGVVGTHAGAYRKRGGVCWYKTTRRGDFDRLVAYALRALDLAAASLLFGAVDECRGEIADVLAVAKRCGGRLQMHAGGVDPIIVEVDAAEHPLRARDVLVPAIPHTDLQIGVHETPRQGRTTGAQQEARPRDSSYRIEVISIMVVCVLDTICLDISALGRRCLTGHLPYTRATYRKHRFNIMELDLYVSRYLVSGAPSLIRKTLPHKTLCQIEKISRKIPEVVCCPSLLDCGTQVLVSSQ